MEKITNLMQSQRNQAADLRQYSYRLFFVVCISFFFSAYPLYGFAITEPSNFTYYLYVSDFANSFIQIPTSNVSDSSTTISSTYLAGRAPIYNVNNTQVGTCSASFLCMQNEDGIYNDISNYLTCEDGMIVTWFTPTTLRNLELDSIINSMVTQCLVTVTTKVGVAPLYQQNFSLIVSSDGGKIYFQFSRIGMIL